jgi:hypothetical protein
MCERSEYLSTIVFGTNVTTKTVILQDSVQFYISLYAMNETVPIKYMNDIVCMNNVKWLLNPENDVQNNYVNVSVLCNKFLFINV